MKHKEMYFKKYSIWMLLLFGVDLMSVLMLWLADVKALRAMILVIVLSSIMLFGIVFLYTFRKEERREQAFYRFLESPDDVYEAEILNLVSIQEGKAIHQIKKILQKQTKENQRLAAQMEDYSEYVELWAHEIKTPITLLVFLLDNHREEFPSGVCKKLDDIRNRIQESVEQMLFYSRLKGVQKDYLYELLSLSECCGEVLENYQPLLEEKGIQLIREIGSISVVSDRRGLRFLIGQIISNAIKYCKDTGVPRIRITSRHKEDFDMLCIKDNGIGVRQCDLPFLFEKGFTGDTGDVRKKATGMGLYIAKAIADDLNIQLEINSKWQEGFEIIIKFPIVGNNTKGFL